MWIFFHTFDIATFIDGWWRCEVWECMAWRPPSFTGTALHGTALNYQPSSVLISFLVLFLFCVLFHFFSPIFILKHLLASHNFHHSYRFHICPHYPPPTMTTLLHWIMCWLIFFFDCPNLSMSISFHPLLNLPAHSSFSLFLTVFLISLLVASQAEKLLPGHKYIGSFPCDRDVGNSKKKGKSGAHL